MSENQRIPMAEIKENEELVTGHGNEVKDKSHRKVSQKNSSASSASDVSFVNPLMNAVRRGKSFKASFLEKIKLDEMDMIETDNLQRNVFHYAVSKPDTLRKLLENAETKTSVQEALNQADEEGETPIHRAAVIANIESLEMLHEYDNSLIKLKTTMGKRSVLHSAVKGRAVVVVKFVLSKDPDLVNTVDSMLQSPLHYAASLKQSNVLECLISKGGDTTIMDANDQLALHIAASKGLKNNVTLLLRENPDFINVIDKSLRSSLLLSAQNNFPTTVAYLLSKNADCAIQDKLELTAFDWAISSDSPEVVQVFLDNKVWKE
ncbi:transient receptor potential cation channel subfamily A member 1-like, partial [Paramuricea clavata]